MNDVEIEKNKNIFRIKLNKDLTAKLVFLAVKKGIKTNKTELEKFIQNLAIEKLNETFEKETQKEIYE